ncbi:hypothetical protein ACFL2H_00650 [Planctomycetota bacterium]
MKLGLKDLAMLIAICAFYFACMARQSDAARTACYTVTFFLILGAIPLAIGMTGAKRAFWLAFFCVSSAYAEFSESDVIWIWPWTIDAPTLVTDQLSDQIETWRAYDEHDTYDEFDFDFDEDAIEDAFDDENPFDFLDDEQKENFDASTEAKDSTDEEIEEFPLNLSIVVHHGPISHNTIIGRGRDPGPACFHSFVAIAFGWIAGRVAAVAVTRSTTSVEN